MSDAAAKTTDEPANPAALPERRGNYAFANFAPASHDQLVIAIEIWHDEICHGSWASKEAMRIGALLSDNVRSCSRQLLNVKDIESSLSIPKDDTLRTFKMLKLFGFVESFSVEGIGNLAISLRLSALQKIRVLETARKLAELSSSELSERRQPTAAAVAPAEPVVPPAGGDVVALPTSAEAEARSAALPPVAHNPVAANLMTLQQKLKAHTAGGNPG